ncbi:MAG: alpha-glucosidase [Breznakibacter sp.]|nr:alpha-glucosidase [Breznakibacter sp.]
MVNSTLTNNKKWWKSAVFYQIYPRSFYDTNSDGIGDLQGIIQKLDYLVYLGINAIWISPIYQSPMFDFGYDISNYKAIDKVFGDLNDFKQLLAEAHKRNIRIVMDLIMNHTSHKHKWFLESSSAISNPKRDWYIWRPSNNKTLPNNWKSVFGGSGWQYHAESGEYYYHSFLKEQPDLNWRNEELQETFFNEVRFWLELGVDGFRLDVLNFIIKDKHFRNNPQPLYIPLFHQHKYTRNRPKSHKIIEKLRQLIDSYPQRMLVAEIYLPPPGDSKIVGNYLGNGENGVHLAFDFSLIFARWGANSYAKCIQKSLDHIPQNGWPTLVLSNHDLLRSINRLGFRTHQTERAKIEAILLLTLRGTPFLYYGEEIGMKNKRIPYPHIQDPIGKKWWPLFSGRDKARTPMQWNSSKNGGFSDAKPWLPVNNDFSSLNVEEQLNDPSSLLNHYKKLIAIRNEYKALAFGYLKIISTTDNILIYNRLFHNHKAVIILNFSSRRKIATLPPYLIDQKPIFATHNNRETQLADNKVILQPFEALIFHLSAV